MVLKFFCCALPITVGLFLCSCSISRNEEYENFLKIEKEKIKAEQIRLEKQKQVNQQEQLDLQKQREQLKKESQLLSQEREKIKKEQLSFRQIKQRQENMLEEFECGKDVACSPNFYGIPDCSLSCDSTGCQGSCAEDIEYIDMKSKRPLTGLIKKKDADYGFSYEARVENGQLNGAINVFKDGVIYLSGNYHNGKPDGSQTLYYPDGKVKSKNVYHDGRELSVVQYHPNGKLDYTRFPDKDYDTYFHLNGSKKRVIKFICPQFLEEAYDTDGKLIEKTVN